MKEIVVILVAVAVFASAEQSGGLLGGLLSGSSSIPGISSGSVISSALGSVPIVGGTLSSISSVIGVVEPFLNPFQSILSLFIAFVRGLFSSLLVGIGVGSASN